MAFAGHYLIWTYLSILGICFLALPKTALKEEHILIAWWIGIIVPAVLFALLRADWRWIVILTVPAALSFLTPLFLEEMWASWPIIAQGEPQMNIIINMMIIIFGILGVMGTEIYRLGNRYYVTNRRLVIEWGWLRVGHRTLLHKRIVDLTVYQTLLGRLFDFGSLTLSTAIRQSGHMVNPLGDETSKAEEISLPNEPHRQLYGVPHPEEVYDLIVSLM
jgi:membrane protein YdbS with pleckstrin-like domain